MPDADVSTAAIDVGRARRETPGCDEVLHFNNAGAALMPRPVVEAHVEHVRLEARVGGYEAAAERADALESVYASVARLLGAQPDEVALAESATRAWQMVFYAMDFAPGDRILTHRAAYASNYIAFLQVARQTGAEVVVVPSDDAGQVDLDALERELRQGAKLVALTHVPTNGGLVNPASEVGALAAEAGTPYLLDACQSAGQLPLDVRALGCTMCSATGRKYLRAPRGTGFLYVRRDWVGRLEPPVLDLHAATWTAPGSYAVRDDARRFEAWEASYAARLGLGAAVAYAMDWGLEAIEGRVTRLAEDLREALRSLAGVTVHDVGRRRCGIVALSHDGAPAEALQQALREQDVNTSVSSRSSTLLDAEARALPDLLRASLHYYNTTDEIDRFVETLRTTLPA